MIKRVHVSANTSQQQKNRQSNTKIHVGPLSESKGIVRPLFLVAACKRANEGVHWSRSKGAKCSINKSFYGGAWKRPWTKAKQHFRLSAFARPVVSFKVSRMQTSFGHCFKLTSSRIPKLLQWVLCLGKRTKNFLSAPSLKLHCHTLAGHWYYVKSAHFQVPENGTSDARIQKLRPIFHANIPPKWWIRCLFYSFTTFGCVIGKFWILKILSMFLKCEKGIFRKGLPG